ncbi:protein disulfide-isomerase A1 [Nematocida displodere]|uniref:protein disulfide-isomerase n=1 Tax=Nematocida displodere TaxID=1805483 RepID=A0A177EH04_9MICR|nr:protein disulfide-isomerase A1 [Nematocida displodere]
MRFNVLVGALVGAGLGFIACEVMTESAETKARAVASQGMASEGMKVTIEGGENQEQEGVSLLLSKSAILFSRMELTDAEVEATQKAMLVPFKVSSDEAFAKENGLSFPGFFYASEFGTYKYPLSEEEAGQETQHKALARKLAILQNIARIPLFGEITENNFKEYEESGLQTVYLVEETGKVESFKWLEETAEAHKYKVKLALLNFTKTEFFLNSAGVKKSMLPALFIIAVEEGKSISKYLLKDAKKASECTEFIQSFLDGTAAQFSMSEDLPSGSEAESEKGVKKVVMHNFKEIAFDITKDTIIVFHVDWCGFCKTFMPEFETLSATLRDAKVTDVVFGKMLMSANDLPVDANVNAIQAFPTIRLFKKGTNEVVDYVNRDKPANAEFVLEFLREHCDIPATVTLPAKTAASSEDAVKDEELKIDL